MRKIIHVDMDAFFASIEQRDNPDLRGKPVAVGYAGDRGVVAAASYEARQYGVRSAMSSKVALRKCPSLIFVKSRFEVYEEVSSQIMDIFHEYTDLVEPLSLDEAFLDVTHNFKNMSIATEIALEIKKKIYKETHLTASAGISYNKFLAKIASDYNKPNGHFIITPKQAEAFVRELPIERFFGVGKVTAEKMHKIGIKTGADLRERSLEYLMGVFGKTGILYYNNSRGIDDRLVETNRERKSVGTENTFSEDYDDIENLDPLLKEIATDLAERVAESKFEGKTITLKVKYADFRTITRSKTLAHLITEFDSMYMIGLELLKAVDLTPKVRLLGLTIKSSNTISWSGPIQLEIDFKD